MMTIKDMAFKGVENCMNENFSSLQRLFLYMRPYRIKITGATLCAILQNIFDVFPEVLIGITVDVLVNKHNSFLAHWGITSVMSQLCFLAGLTFTIWCCQALCEYLSDMLWRNLAQTIQHDLRVAAYGHMQQLEMAYFEDKNTGELLTILNEDVNQLELFFDKGIADFIYFVVSVCVVGCIFFYLSPMVALCAFFPVPLIFYIAHTFQGRLGELYMHVREKAGVLGARLGNNLMGISTIKSYTTEEYELAKMRDDSSAYKNAHAHSIALNSAFIPVIRIAIAFGFVITIVLGGAYTLQGSLAIGGYSILVSMTQRLLWPFIYLAKSMDVYKRSMASAHRVFAVLDTPIGITDGSVAQSIGVKGKIEFKDISFAYPNGITVFDNLSISVEPGQTVGVVGSTGSGKTTLIKLLLRFYDPKQGSILLDGIYTKDLTLQLLRQTFGLVSQDVFIFKGTIRENIAYGAPHISDAQIEYAARMAEIHDFIMNLPHGYDTMVGERGQKLSGGQRQRISIARALVHNPPILIFDEATSSIDNETELSIQRSLEKIAKNHTIFVIAHRLSTIRHADNIFVLDKGEVVENGKHDDLLRLDGIYAKLWRVQTGEISSL
jgi:ATP-binding cassette subfamily B protein